MKQRRLGLPTSDCGEREGGGSLHSLATGRTCVSTFMSRGFEESDSRCAPNASKSRRLMAMA